MKVCFIPVYAQDWYWYSSGGWTEHNNIFFYLVKSRELELQAHKQWSAAVPTLCFACRKKTTTTVANLLTIYTTIPVSSTRGQRHGLASMNKTKCNSRTWCSKISRLWYSRGSSKNCCFGTDTTLMMLMIPRETIATVLIIFQVMLASHLKAIAVNLKDRCYCLILTITLVLVHSHGMMSGSLTIISSTKQLSRRRLFQQWQTSTRKARHRLLDLESELDLELIESRRQRP